MIKKEKRPKWRNCKQTVAAKYSEFKIVFPSESVVYIWDLVSVDFAQLKLASSRDYFTAKALRPIYTGDFKAKQCV